jgi:Pyridoxamine 5'-phosphate oxidase
MPGNRIHQSRWVRLVVREVYWFGGFGDRAYIGWIPRSTWQNVTEEEIEDCKLPGEQGSFWQRLYRRLEL